MESHCCSLVPAVPVVVRKLRDIFLSSCAELCKETQILAVVALLVSFTDTSGSSRESIAPVAREKNHSL